MVVICHPEVGEWRERTVGCGGVLVQGYKISVRMVTVVTDNIFLKIVDRF